MSTESITYVVDKAWFRPYGKHLSELGISVIHGLFMEGKTISQAARHLGISYSGSHRRYRKWSKMHPKKG